VGNVNVMLPDTPRRKFDTMEAPPSAFCAAGNLQLTQEQADGWAEDAHIMLSEGQVIPTFCANVICSRRLPAADAGAVG